MFLSVLFTCMQRFKHVAQVHSEIRKCKKMSILHAMWHLKQFSLVMLNIPTESLPKPKLL